MSGGKLIVLISAAGSKRQTLRKFKTMERKHFYITLYSNASQKLYPNNTQAAFTFHLAQPVDLGTSSDWEVGLVKSRTSLLNVL